MVLVEVKLWRWWDVLLPLAPLVTHGYDRITIPCRIGRVGIVIGFGSIPN